MRFTSSWISKLAVLNTSLASSTDIFHNFAFPYTALIFYTARTVSDVYMTVMQSTNEMQLF